MRPTLAASIAVTVLAAAVAACATEAGPGDKPQDGDAYYEAMVTRGRLYAERVCLSCHARIDAERPPVAGAPSLASFARAYDSPYRLQAKLSDIAESGHYRMPPTQPHADEVEALAAYIGSLRKDEESRVEHERF